VREQGLALEVRSAPAEQALPALPRGGRALEAAVANLPRAGTRCAREAPAAGDRAVSRSRARWRDLAHFRELVPLRAV
jgi:hypothetical protein